MTDRGAEWLRRAARAVYHSAPPRFWQGFDGVKRDLASLPARLKDPDRRRDPWETIHHVGGDYHNEGLVSLDMLRTHGGLQPHDKVLDIGCGSGRVAGPLATALSAEGGYTGFDVSPAAIRYCRRRISPMRPDFSFQLIDGRNNIYNPRGAVEETEVRFPCEDGVVTLAFATSVLTHLLWPTVLHYLAETRRVLAPGGRALLTAFAITPQVRIWIEAGRTHLRLEPFGPHAMTGDPHWPENAMGYDEDALRQAAADAGLEVVAVLAGQWRPEPQHRGGQDLLVLRRPLDEAA